MGVSAPGCGLDYCMRYAMYPYVYEDHVQDVRECTLYESVGRHGCRILTRVAATRLAAVRVTGYRHRSLLNATRRCGTVRDPVRRHSLRAHIRNPYAHTQTPRHRHDCMSRLHFPCTRACPLSLPSCVSLAFGPSPTPPSAARCFVATFFSAFSPCRDTHASARARTHTHMHTGFLGAFSVSRLPSSSLVQTQTLTLVSFQA